MNHFPPEIRKAGAKGAGLRVRWPHEPGGGELTSLPPLPSLAHLHQGRVQVNVVRHDDGADDAHGLQQLWTAAARARGQEQAPKKR